MQRQRRDRIARGRHRERPRHARRRDQRPRIRPEDRSRGRQIAHDDDDRLRGRPRRVARREREGLGPDVVKGRRVGQLPRFRREHIARRRRRALQRQDGLRISLRDGNREDHRHAHGCAERTGRGSESRRDLAFQGRRARHRRERSRAGGNRRHAEIIGRGGRQAGHGFAGSGNRSIRESRDECGGAARVALQQDVVHAPGRAARLFPTQAQVVRADGAGRQRQIGHHVPAHGGVGGGQAGNRERIPRGAVVGGPLHVEGHVRGRRFLAIAETEPQFVVAARVDPRDGESRVAGRGRGEIDVGVARGRIARGVDITGGGRSRPDFRRPRRAAVGHRENVVVESVRRLVLDQGRRARRHAHGFAEDRRPGPARA